MVKHNTAFDDRTDGALQQHQLINAVNVADPKHVTTHFEEGKGSKVVKSSNISEDR